MLSTVRAGQSLIKHSFDRRRSGLDGHTTPESTADRARSPLRNTARLTVSAALSQHGGTWPVDGRIVGVFATADSDLADLSAAVAAIAAASMTPLVIAAHGGEFGSGAKQVAISRTLDAARSIEFDALVIAGAVTDPRLYLLMQEAHRHLEAISYTPDGADAVAAAGISEKSIGVEAAPTIVGAFDAIAALLPEHRVWARVEE